MNRAKEVEEIVEGFKALRQRLGSKGEKKGLGDVTQTQGMALAYIARHEQATVKDLCAAFGITSSAATQLINPLVKNGYVLRKTHPDDGRASVLVLTAKAKSSFAAWKRNRVKEITMLFSVLTDKEFAQYIALHRKIMKSVS